MCLCTNTPGDSNNNAVVLGSHRAARAVKPFVSGGTTHYITIPKIRVPSGGTEQPWRKRGLFLTPCAPLCFCKPRLESCETNRVWANGSVHLVRAGRGENRRGGDRRGGGK